MNAEKQRLALSKKNSNWKKWGPYLTQRQWGTVREDYSPYGTAWESITHDMARSNAYRWGEEGIGGISDKGQFICFGWAFWNGKDPILKERIFGLTGHEGNHGEDVKEYYYYLDSTPTHSYMKMLYKYPQKAFPYEQLVKENRSRTKADPEYELIDTGVFDNNKYFDIFLEYAKGDVDDILMTATIHNQSDEEAELVVLPTVWFRNVWRGKTGSFTYKIFTENDQHLIMLHDELGRYHMYLDDSQELLFCDNETNRKRIYGTDSTHTYFKDGINNYIVDNSCASVNENKEGTKASGLFRIKIEGNGVKTVRVRLTNQYLKDPFSNFDEICLSRKTEADEFYHDIQKNNPDADLRNIQRQAFAGMMWSKQYYYYNVRKWLDGDEGKFPPPSVRKSGRNSKWRHLANEDIISMPDKWEYPWYAAWDLAFHCIPISRIDPDFAKEQLLLLLSEHYLHPNGQIPAYEWNFSDVNPPVHAWAVLRVYQIDKKMKGGKGDIDFLQRSFHKLLLNFTWWVNQKDTDGNNIFEGGFLGLDNIGVFDRSNVPSLGFFLEQSDGTSWMAMFSLNMLRISLDLATDNIVYQDLAVKFFEHFLHIASALNNIGENNVNLWEEEDQFYYDILHLSDGSSHRLKVRSLVGLIPLFAVETLKHEAYQKLPEFRTRLETIIKEVPELSSLISKFHEPRKEERRLIALLRKKRMEKILERMLDPEEFLSDFGIRALSRYHQQNPYKFEYDGRLYSVDYQPGESTTQMFGGNSNWRGPIWFPVNYLILESLRKFYAYYGDSLKIEYPRESGKKVNLEDLSYLLSERLFAIFKKDSKGERAVYGDYPKINNDPHFSDHILFYEFFHGDLGHGLGATHQTGWTGLIADMIHKYYNRKQD